MDQHPIQYTDPDCVHYQDGGKTCRSGSLYLGAQRRPRRAPEYSSPYRGITVPSRPFGALAEAGVHSGQYHRVRKLLRELKLGGNDVSRFSLGPRGRQGVQWVLAVLGMSLMMLAAPTIIHWIFGYRSMTPPLGLVVSVACAVLFVRIVSARCPTVVRAIACLIVGVSLLLLWPYPQGSFEEFSWVLVWSLFSGSLIVVSLGSVLIGFLPGGTIRSEGARKVSR